MYEQSQTFIKNECVGNMTTHINMYKASILRNVTISQKTNRSFKQMRTQK